ncbi:MAG: hypothetical protein KIT87_30085, partial [Anaerolineae bacterium]|nr:hypothetical protein [Anaerolineae bacterium]
AADQDLAGVGLERDRHNRQVYCDPNANFHVLQAASLAEAVTLLAMDAATRWGAILDTSVELRRHSNFVGRAWLKAQVEAVVASQDSGYLLLTAGPGLGKSAFVAEQVRTALSPVVHHFIKRGMGDWDNPSVFLRSLTAQLRRKYVLLPPDDEQSMSPSQVFLRTLGQVSDCLEVGESEVIYLDGLDEAFGSMSRFHQIALPGVLPRYLPSGIVIVLTSRPGEHLGWLADPSLCHRLDLDPDARDNRADIRAYLEQQNEARGLGLDQELMDRLVVATEGFFIVAVLYLRQRPELRDELRAWRDAPQRIPRGLTGWLTEEWQRLIFAARQEGIPADVVRGVMGLLVAAQEPLSREQLTTFLSYADRQPSSAGSPLTIGFVPISELGRHLGRVMELAQEFFEPLDPSQGANAPYRFFHTRFSEFTVAQVTEVELRDSHHVLAEGCLGWPTFPDNASQYAVEYVLSHCAVGLQWGIGVSLLTDFGYLKQLARQLKHQGTWPGSLRLENFLNKIILQIPTVFRMNNQKLERLSSNLGTIVECLDFTLWSYYRPAFELNKSPHELIADHEAVCSSCGERTIIHGSLDLGSIDYEMHYFVWCTNCFWAWKEEEEWRNMQDNVVIREFDYSTNTYR